MMVVFSEIRWLLCFDFNKFNKTNSEYLYFLVDF